MASTGTPGTTTNRQPRHYPRQCWHCGHELPPPVTGPVLDAARALVSLGGEGTSRDVVAAGVTPRQTRASELLRQAERAGLVRHVGERHTGHGRGARLYRADTRVVSSYGK